MRLFKVVLAVVIILFFVVAPSAKAQVTVEDQAKNCCDMTSKEDNSLVNAGAAQALYSWLVKGSYDRVGKVPHCAADQDHDAGLCYKKCPAGFKGVGPVCWQHCPDGYKDDGATCRKDTHIFKKDSYGRGVGKPMHLTRHGWRCSDSHPDKDAGLCYENCRGGYNGVGPVCWQKDCPDGYKDDGGTCRRDVHIFGKKSHGRGAGTPPKICGADAGYTHLSMSMCYKPAKYCHDCTGSHCIRTATDCGMCKASKAHRGSTPMPFEDKTHEICATSQAYADSCAKDRSWVDVLKKSTYKYDHSSYQYGCRGKNLVVTDENGYIIKEK